MLLKAILFTGIEAFEAWKKWTARVDLNTIDPASFNLLPMICRNPALIELKDPVFGKCQGIYRQTWVANQLQWVKMLPILNQLFQAGVTKIILLKGMAMTHHYYRDFGVRVMGDIDILIHRDELSMLAPLLQSTGWKQTYSRIDLKNQEHLNRWHALNFTHPEGMKLDLHWSFIQEHCPFLDDAVYKSSKPLATPSLHTHLAYKQKSSSLCNGPFQGIDIPNPTDLFLQTCLHGIKPSPVPLIRWVADAMTIIRWDQKQIDWDRLVELSNQANVSLQLSLACQYLKEEFNAPIPQNTIQQLQQSPTIRLQSLEYQANNRRSPFLAAWYRYSLKQGHLTIRSQWIHLHKYLQITARLKSPWLIPFYGIYWIFKRIFRYLFVRIKSANHKSI